MCPRSKYISAAITYNAGFDTLSPIVLGKNDRQPC
jgi:hypothetical protein